MVNSMTGFAAGTGQGLEHSWSWELRSLNSKGLDLRLRVPDWVEGLEAALRARLAKVVKRGSIALNLRLSRDSGEAAGEIDAAMLDRALAQIAEVSRAAEGQGVSLRQPSAGEVLAMRGVLAQAQQTTDTTALRSMLLADFEAVLSDFLDTRVKEGHALADVLHRQVDEIDRLTLDAETRLPERAEKARAALRNALARVVENTDGADPDRVAQELAVLAVKSDVTEEIDRLRTHVRAARDLLGAEGPIGRKLDFLTQEFNREANTLCSKSQDVALTGIGLDLKASIDQMREQVQNVE
ncbi:uncharacterized protein (TIGR00255 family) [Aliiruegeria haliotis]|uniref:Uncharacterized protein (TIGR00255 family) n=1 Tax=Aliiruegeria haliotis TaxID=1280846 RepID=A0A2T0S097_9RHOB|nr:YicC/YloC family endoribonuclease [Aliiruegeria haliotis]PRY26792.1 uncharacterized protein (TIGR00255 family) [Aliiruegeria haliotis]